MVQTGHHAYRQNASVTVMSQEQLLFKLYDGAVNFTRLAKRGMEEKNPRVKGENISKVIAIVSELDCALDRQVGGDIAANLSSLYQHIIFRLVDANLKNDLPGLDEVESILVKLKEGFFEAAKINRTEQLEARCAQPTGVEHKGGMCLAI
ncbi:flagellar export chaperone FliS [Desulfatiferula olefinivorans]